jgi:hypothetical protein
MAGRPNTLPWNVATFTGNEPATTLSDNFSSLNNIINDSGAGFTSYAIDTGTANNLIVTLPSAPVAYEAGMMVVTPPAFTNTGASVINVNSLGNVAIVTPANLALSGGELSKTVAVALVYDGSSFRIIGPCARVSSSTSATSVTINCAGYSSVNIQVQYTATGANTQLSNLAQGVPVTLLINNISGAAGPFTINGTNSAGAGFTSVVGVTSGAAGGSLLSNLASGISINNTSAMMFIGGSVGALSLNFSH